jgi:hypothetical protein
MSEETASALTNYLRKGEIDSAMSIIRRAHDHHEAEGFVFAVRKEEASTPEVIDAVLEAFLSTRRNRSGSGGHGSWVHSLSHFTATLWMRRLDVWIKKFNEVAFRGANELGDSNCSDRLVRNFAEFAKWNDHPAEFYITPENIGGWMKWDYHPYAKARIEAGAFESEGDFLCWELRRPETHMAFDFDAQINLVDIKEIRSLIERLETFGMDTAEFKDLERDLLTKRLSELEEELPTAKEDWKRERLTKGIEKTKAALAS